MLFRLCKLRYPFNCHITTAHSCIISLKILQVKYRVSLHKNVTQSKACVIVKYDIAVRVGRGITGAVDSRPLE